MLATDAAASAKRPLPSRDLSYTHVFPARRAPTANQNTPALPNSAQESSSRSRSQARPHQGFDSATAFYGGLDWLLDAAIDSEPKSKPLSLKGDPLTEAILRTLNRHSERSGRLAGQGKEGRVTTMMTGSATSPTKMKTQTSWSSSEGINTASSRSEESPELT